MEPHIRTGSLVLVTKNAGEPQVGEVWTFLTPRSKQVTTHRILNKRVEKDKLLYSTQGDANDTPDPWILENGNMIGKVKFSVPFAGYLAHYAKTPQGFFLIAVVPGLLLIIDEIWKIKKIIELNHQNEVLKLKKELEETKEKVKKQG
jgi:signal peptidase